MIKIRVESAGYAVLIVKHRRAWVIESVYGDCPLTGSSYTKASQALTALESLEV